MTFNNSIPIPNNNPINIEPQLSNQNNPPINSIIQPPLPINPILQPPVPINIPNPLVAEPVSQPNN